MSIINKNDESLSCKIIHLIAKHASSKPENIDIDTRIGEDLRILGDDADELLTELSAKFDVDLSDFIAYDYFPGEASADMHYYITNIAVSKYTNPIVKVVRFFESRFWKLFVKKMHYKTLTVGDIIEITKKGKWSSF